MIESDHRKDSLQVNQPILCMGLTQWLEQRRICLLIPIRQIKAYICTAKSTVQVTHSHNPFFSQENSLQLFVLNKKTKIFRVEGKYPNTCLILFNNPYL